VFSDFHAKRRWRELGYGSAFPYLRGEFKLSEGAAYNRIVAAELVHRVPEVEAAVRSGDLCFSTVNQVAKVLTPENKDELLPRFRHLSRRQAEQLAVSLRPVEVIPLREVVTAIRPPRAAARAAAAITPPAAEAVETCAAGTDAFQLHPGEVANEVGVSPSADASLFQLHPGEVAAPVPVAVVQVPPEPPRDEVEPLDAKLSRLHITVDDELLQLLEASKNAFSHSFPSGRAVDVIKHGLRVGPQHAPEPRPARSSANGSVAATWNERHGPVDTSWPSHGSRSRVFSSGTRHQSGARPTSPASAEAQPSENGRVIESGRPHM
jgi:hypothetical protein